MSPKTGRPSSGVAGGIHVSHQPAGGHARLSAGQLGCALVAFRGGDVLSLLSAAVPLRARPLDLSRAACLPRAWAVWTHCTYAWQRDLAGILVPRRHRRDRHGLHDRSAATSSRDLAHNAAVLRGRRSGAAGVLSLLLSHGGQAGSGGCGSGHDAGRPGSLPAHCGCRANRMACTPLAEPGSGIRPAQL